MVWEFFHEVGRKIIEVLDKEGRREWGVRLDDHLGLDLGIDSLGRVELTVALEGVLKINIPDDTMAGVFTVKELILEMEKLILGEEFQGRAISQIKTQASLWNKIMDIIHM